MDFLETDKLSYSPAEPIVITYDFTEMLRIYPAVNLIIRSNGEIEVGPAIDRAGPKGTKVILTPTLSSLDVRGVLFLSTDRWRDDFLRTLSVGLKLEFAGDYDQYFWVRNTRSGGTLSMEITAFQPPLILLDDRAAVAHQLWKFSGGALVCKANGLVLQAPVTAGGTFLLQKGGNPLPLVQKWTIESDGTLRSGSGLAIHALEPRPRSHIEAQSASTPGEWFLTPCAVGVDASPNQLSAYQSGAHFYVVESATDQVLTATSRRAGRPRLLCLERDDVISRRQLWSFDGQCLHSAVGNAVGNWVLDASGEQVVIVAPSSPPSLTQQWILSASGFLVNLASGAEGGWVATLIAEAVALERYTPLPRFPHTWYLSEHALPTVPAAAARAIAPVSAFFDPGTVITSLKVSAQISSDFWSGTADDISVGFNRSLRTTLLFHAPATGATALVTINLATTFPGRTMTIADLGSLELYQLPVPHPLWSDACKIETLILIVNGRFYNYSFEWMNEWVDAPVGAGPSTPAWTRGIPDSGWRDIKLEGRARWMTAGMSVIGARSLSEIMVPGSHDAGMYPGGVSWFGQTQDLSLYDQLMEGVRYFDLRPSLLRINPFNEDDLRRDLFIIHSSAPRGPMLSTVLDDVARYMSAPGKEVVMLKISHYENFDADVYGRMVRLIQAKLGQWLHTGPLTGRLAQTPISTLAGENGAVLVLCDKGYPRQAPTAGFFVYRDDNAGDVDQGQITVYDKYSNTDDATKMMDGQIAAFNRFDGKCRADPNVPCDLFLLSWTLTRPLYIWGLASQVNPLLAGKLNGQNIPNGYGKIPNVLYVDYVETSGATDICIARNGIILTN